MEDSGIHELLEGMKRWREWVVMRCWELKEEYKTLTHVLFGLTMKGMGKSLARDV